MKKYLFSLAIVFCVLLLCSSSLAEETPLACHKCGNTDLEWFTLTSGDGLDYHVRFCETCYMMVGEKELCVPLPGSATCTGPERCKICGFRLTSSMSPDPDAHTWENPSYYWNNLGDADEDGISEFACTVIRICKNYCGSSHVETVDASFAITTPSTCYLQGTVTYTASFKESWAETQVVEQVGIVPYAEHTEVTIEAVEPTCEKTGLTEGKACSVCNKVLEPQKIVPVTDHNYKPEIVAPTCAKGGYTEYICSGCLDTYIVNETKARGHWYDLWKPNQDSSHTAVCRRNDCTHKGRTECEKYEVTLTEGETETILTVCPVCGDYKDTFFNVIYESNINTPQPHALPRGEQIVRGMEAPFKGVMYAFTAAYEYDGKIVPFSGISSVTIPLDADKYADFNVVRVDVTPSSENAPRTEIWTDIPFTIDNGKLSIETDTEGLFLLIPQN